MVTFSALIKKFGALGEKTGWTYIDVPEAIAIQLMPENKRAFRVKGSLDTHNFEGISLVPMGGGDFILPLNATIRKALGKTKGAICRVTMDVDTTPFVLCEELMQCLADEPAALEFFRQLAKSHQKYFNNWIESAKTDATKAKRIAQSVTACTRKQGYGEMIRSLKKDRNDLLK